MSPVPYSIENYCIACYEELTDANLAYRGAARCVACWNKEGEGESHG